MTFGLRQPPSRVASAPMSQERTYLELSDTRQDSSVALADELS